MKEIIDGHYLAALEHVQIRQQTNSPPHEKVDPNHLISSRSTIDLDRFADQLSAIARELRRVPLAFDNTAKRGEDPHRPFDQFSNEAASGSPSAARLGENHHVRAAKAEVAREIYTQRRRRAALFGSADLFGEPAWDILLDLYIAEAEGKTVSVSSACIGSAAPPTTGLRWLGVLAENDLILREHDPEDQRRVLVCLTERGLNAMDQFFSGF